MIRALRFFLIVAKIYVFFYFWRFLQNAIFSKNTHMVKETRELPGERNNARNNARCTQARKATHGLDGQYQDVDTELTRWLHEYAETVYS